MTTATVQIDLYKILSERIEASVQYALRRATKHVAWSHYQGESNRDELAEKVTEAVLSGVCEVIQFDSEARLEVYPPDRRAGG